MKESLPIGTVSCDYLTMDDFLAQAREWLRTSSFHHVVTLNPEMVMAAEQDVAFRSAVAAADLRVPDGAGLIWARWYIRSQFWSLWPSLAAFPFVHAERVSGVDTLQALMSVAAEDNHSVYLLGGTQSQVTKTAQRLRQQWPTVTIHTSPDHQWNLQGPRAVLDDIAAKQPALLFVAYGAPAQTLWIETHRQNLSSVRLALGVGGAFAILSEERPRAPYWLRKLNIEWLWRLILEPSRLPRIWRATVLFPLLVHRQKKAHPPKFSTTE